MHKTIWMALAAADLLASDPSRAMDPVNKPGLPGMAAPATTISPVFHQLVVFTLPAHFRAVFEKTNGSFYIREHVADGDNEEHWTRMVTLTATRDLASSQNASAQGLVERIAAGFGRHCPDTFAGASLGQRLVGSYEGFVVIASCGHVQSGSGSYSETAIMMSVKGSADYYTLQWAERGPASAQPLKLDPAYWENQLAKLAPVRLCPIVPGEPAPYVSCVGK